MEMDKNLIEAGWNLDNSYTLLPKSLYSSLNPTPVRNPKLIILNHSLAKALGFNPQTLQGDECVKVLAGNGIPVGASPIAQAYAGHQYGHFTMLGDGRAILLGEQITPSGERYDIQLKGSGMTPYSRRGDGRAALGPMLREYIISEAMNALGIPTTRSLAVVKTGESVIRETILPGAVLTRIASSHIRVGTFQYVSNWCTIDDLHALADYTIQRHFPGIEQDKDRYLSMLKEVIKRQAELIAKWQLVGFVHGVMNTDNMTISGETIDYGPCAFMDSYDPATVFSSIDTYGRYAYGNQPGIAVWNLSRLAEALLPLLHEKKEQAIQLANDAISEFSVLFKEYWMNGMKSKLGMTWYDSEDEGLIMELLHVMEKHGTDYTNTFRALTRNKPEDTGLNHEKEFSQWYERWQRRLERQQGSVTEAYQLMKKSNPSIIPRNHRVEEALKAAVERADYNIMDNLLYILSDPYAYSPEQEEYATLPEQSSCNYRTFCGT
ncbi:MAG: hypothetical protein K0S47_3492 [Herbinix sp.]|jgi:uncharacterized protein YdiU (UPF0061 family)|nr:hypothetical protein [Herbinix sp.]